MHKSRLLHAAGLSAILLALSACGHHDLTAPCERGSRLWSFGSAYADNCGPLLPVNR